MSQTRFDSINDMMTVRLEPHMQTSHHHVRASFLHDLVPLTLHKYTTPTTPSHPELQ
jgi:hypothetical protein